jgi:RHS repeat-associated protein
LSAAIATTNRATVPYSRDACEGERRLRIFQTTGNATSMSTGLRLTGDSFVYGSDDRLIELINNLTGTVPYLHHDQQGSTRLLTGSTGTVTGKCSYAAYGTFTCEGTATTSLWCDGEHTSSDTGLIYMRARTCDPSTAQFLSVDPLEKLTGALCHGQYATRRRPKH